jgi:hypothetical protein
MLFFSPQKVESLRRFYGFGTTRAPQECPPKSPLIAKIAPLKLLAYPMDGLMRQQNRHSFYAEAGGSANLETDRQTDRMIDGRTDRAIILCDVFAFKQAKLLLPYLVLPVL